MESTVLYISEAFVKLYLMKRAVLLSTEPAETIPFHALAFYITRKDF